MLAEIPEEIGNLQLLEELSIQYKGLKGSIPLTLFNMSSLKVMDFTGNKLVGSLPDNLCQIFLLLKDYISLTISLVV